MLQRDISKCVCELDPFILPTSDKAINLPFLLYLIQLSWSFRYLLALLRAARRSANIPKLIILTPLSSPLLHGSSGAPAFQCSYYFFPLSPNFILSSHVRPITPTTAEADTLLFSLRCLQELITSASAWGTLPATVLFTRLEDSGVWPGFPWKQDSKLLRKQSTVGTSHKKVSHASSLFFLPEPGCLILHCGRLEKEVSDQPGQKTFPAEVLGSCMQWCWC